MGHSDLNGDPANYRVIARILFVFFLINGFVLLVLNVDLIESCLIGWLGQTEAFSIRLFFWGMTGATIASSVFMAKDKDRNVNENTKQKPDPLELQYPDAIDVWLYAQRIVSSGFLAILGAAILIGGLGYFDVPTTGLTDKHQVFFVIVAFVIGLNENRFLHSLDGMSRTLFSKGSSQSKS